MLPHSCILCAAHCTGRDLCAGCRADLPWLGVACRRCAAPLPDLPGPGECGRCLRCPPPQAGTLIPFAYAFPVDQLLQKLKFGNSLPPGRVLGELLGDFIGAQSAPPTSRCPAGSCVGGPHRGPIAVGQRPGAIVPIPLHPKRQRERGYNQALEIARPVARALGIPVLKACRRTRDTQPQSTLAGADRRRNLKHAFIADARVAGLHVAVIDDVYTTGSTVIAATRALLAAGATRVDAWCVARA